MLISLTSVNEKKKKKICNVQWKIVLNFNETENKSGWCLQNDRPLDLSPTTFAVCIKDIHGYMGILFIFHEHQDTLKNMV